MDEREAFQRMRRVHLGSDAPMYANLGRYYEPFEEIVAPISPQALEFAFPPLPPNTTAPFAPFEADVAMGWTPLRQFVEIDEDISPVQTTAHLPQVFCPTPIRPAPAVDYPAIPASPSASPVEREVTRIGSLLIEDLKTTDGIKEETEDHAEGTEDEYRCAESTDEEAGYAGQGPSNRRGKKSIQRRREEVAPYSLGGNTSTRVHKPRVV